MGSSGQKHILIIVFFVTAFVSLIIWWLLRESPLNVSERIPGMDNRPKQEPRSDSVIIGENFDTLGTFDELILGEWPRFRGADFDNISKDITPLREKWDTSGPEVVWQTTLGEGYA